MARVTPLVFGFVLVLAFLLMLVTFRSVVSAVKSVLLNLLSVGAACGVLVLIFQEGWGKSVLGFEVTGGIDPFLPVLLFVILFGLSMDYHVLILSRVREAYDGGMTTQEAVAHGIRSTAGVVTSAAARPLELVPAPLAGLAAPPGARALPRPGPRARRHQ